MIGSVLSMIFYTGILYGVVGTILIEGIIVVIYHLIGERRRDGKSE